jgi:hypothetical protein
MCAADEQHWIEASRDGDNFGVWGAMEDAPAPLAGGVPGAQRAAPAMTHLRRCRKRLGRIAPALGLQSVFDEQDCSVDVGSLAGKSSGGQVFVPSS